MASALVSTVPAEDAHAAVRRSLDALAGNQIGAALAAAETALHLCPESPAAHHVLGLAAFRLGWLATAIRLFEQAHKASPTGFEHAEALAICYAAAGRLVDSVYYGKLATALAPSGGSAELLPSWIGTFADHFRAIQEDPLVTRGSVLLAAGRPNAAKEMFQQEIELDRHSGRAWRGLAEASLAAGRPVDAVVAYQALSEIEPDDAANLAALGHALSLAGRHDEALASYRQACELSPEPTIHAGLIAAAAADPEMPRARVAAAIEDWAKAQSAIVSHRPPVPPLGGRPLRVGFVSARFCAGMGLDLFLPVIEARDRGEWHASLYIAGHGEDALGRRLRNAAVSVTEIAEVDDETAALLLGNDGLDVLIDLDLHEACWRGGIAIQRPAAAVLGWLGLGETSTALGYDAMIGDCWTHDGDGRGLLAVPGGVFCLPADAVADPPRPMGTGAPIFTTPATAAQMTPRVVAVWAQLLGAVPQAMLRLDPERLGGIAGTMRERFAAHGVGAQVSMTPAPAGDAVGDVVLDPPQAGGPAETALAALQAGVPIVTLPGTIPARRRVASLLGALGLHGLVAADADDYVQIAAALTVPAARNYAVRCIAEGFDRRAALAPAARAAAFNAALRRFLAARAA